MGLPLLVAVTVGLVWLLSVGVAQVRVVDAARETARAAARGEEPSVAVDAGRRVVPDGGVVAVAVSGDEVTATATARVRGPGGLFDFLPGVVVTAQAVARSEES